MPKNLDLPTFIIDAINSGSIKALQELLTEHELTETVNKMTDPDKLTPYLRAAKIGKPELYDYFSTLPHFDVNRTDKHGLNALFLTTLTGKTAMFDHLVTNYGFDPKSTHQKITPDYYAAVAGRKEMLQHLLTRYNYPVTPDLINFANNNGQTAIGDYLKEVAQLNQKLSAEISDKNLPAFRKLCESGGAKPKSATNNLAEFAALNGASDIFEYLVDRHNFREFDAQLLANDALERNDSRLLEVLFLKYDLEPQVSPSHLQNDAAKYLANLNSANQKFSKAVKENNLALTAEILSQKLVFKSSINDAALEAAANGNLELYKLISQNPKFDKKIRDENGHSILFSAATSGDVKTVDYLITEQGFSFENESRNQIFAAVVKNCPEDKKDDKKLEMLSFLIAKDIGFIFKDDYKQHAQEATARLENYSGILQDQDSEIKNLLSRARQKVKKISDDFLSNRSQDKIIADFEELQTVSENPYQAAKYLFKSDSNQEYTPLISFITQNNYKKLYQEIASNEPELRFDHNDNAAEFYSAAIKKGNQFKSHTSGFDVFEFAAENFGDTRQILGLQYETGKDQWLHGYLSRLAASGKIPQKQYSTEEIVTCILPKDSDLISWKAKDDPNIYYSFQNPNLPGLPKGKTFTKKEKDLFRNVVQQTKDDIFVPINEIELSVEDLIALRGNSFNKNVFFIYKAPLNDHMHADYRYVKQDFEREVSQKFFILPASGTFDEYAALHQLAIGVAGLKHPSFYGANIDNSPYCDYDVTTSQTVMSHICDNNFYSTECFNVVDSSKKAASSGRIAFTQADIAAMTTSLAKQFPSVDERLVELENQNNFTPWDSQSSYKSSYADAAQITLGALALVGAVKYLASYLFRPGNKVEKGSSTKVSGKDTQKEHSN
ncbi:MAG: hypothetical protein V4694_05990 [Pseudomonadota bacterium]